MKTEIRITHGGEQLCVEVTVSSPPFPRRDINGRTAANAGALKNPGWLEEIRQHPALQLP